MAEPIFPIIDICFNWNNFKDKMVPFFTQKYIYTCSNEVFEKYYLNHLVVDMQFNTFRIVQRKPTSFIRGFIFGKYELLFEKEKTVSNLSTVKNYVVENIVILNNEKPSEIYDAIIREVKSANKIADIIYGEKINYQYQ